MNIYLVQRTDDWNYDDFDSFVVIAKDEEEARNTHPYHNPNTPEYEVGDWNDSCSWIRGDSKDSLTVTLLGKTNKEYKIRKVVCASFNAG